tara:strand:+ start:347 stop:613 length:267 start_codon:yes stop_codon:yes gene_type:complete
MAHPSASLNTNAIYEAGTTAVTPPDGKVIYAITNLSDASVTLSVVCNWLEDDKSTSVTSIKIPIGVTVYGNFTSVTNGASKDIVCYYN